MPLNFEDSWRWWLSPFSGATTHFLNDWVIWHARVMVLAWAVLLPLGAVAARYFKVTPWQSWPQQLDNRFWWHAHRLLQYSGSALMVLGVALSWGHGALATPVAQWHATLGWFVIALGVLQLVSAWSRGSKGGPTEPYLRGDHYDMTPHRLWFERLHKAGGWLALVLAVVTVGLGLWAADAPRWMALVLSAWWLALFLAATRLERTGRCVDTYQAIWGPNPKHPGNQRSHPGWGMRRPHDDRTSG